MGWIKMQPDVLTIKHEMNNIIHHEPNIKREMDKIQPNF